MHLAEDSAVIVYRCSFSTSNKEKFPGKRMRLSHLIMSTTASPHRCIPRNFHLNKIEWCTREWCSLINCSIVCVYFRRGELASQNVCHYQRVLLVSKYVYTESHCSAIVKFRFFSIGIDSAISRETRAVARVLEPTTVRNFEQS